MRDHLVDLRLAEIHPLTGVDREPHRRAMTTALGDDFVASCADMTPSQLVFCAPPT